MTDKVINFSTGRPIESAEEPEPQAADQAEAEYQAAYKADILNMLDRVRARVEHGDLDGLVVLGRHAGAGAFMGASIFDHARMRPDGYFAYAGMMQAMITDMIGFADIGPHLSLDGKLFAVQPEGYEDFQE